ncbi:MAG: TauD/TfdA family dioxygenase [Rhodospirillaceae bacterium]|jgi:taurine dioxygenase|nr:TauD/TfdA family dioxygenase [Rhodospirillaceae bacterium]MBT5457715.1 TauD/TfdA family dioxygenase [Rhodospirillaceae bacterium]
MSLTITPFSAPLGAEVTGIDLRQPLDKDTIDRIYAAWLDHIVLVFRDQELSKDQQVDFAAQFGTISDRATPKELLNETDPDYDGKIMLVTNLRDEKGNPVGTLPDGEMWFHHDQSYMPTPCKATLLHAIELPSEGGNTKFANMYKAYENVPEALKEKLCGGTVLQAYNRSTVVRVDPEDGLDGIAHQWQPIFVKHAETGRPALYVSHLISSQIDGMDRNESEAVLEQLIAIAEDPALVYEHVWRDGDLVMWDNRCSTHARTDFPPEETRLLRRCTLEGGPMIAAA